MVFVDLVLVFYVEFVFKFICFYVFIEMVDDDEGIVEIFKGLCWFNFFCFFSFYCCFIIVDLFVLKLRFKLVFKILLNVFGGGECFWVVLVCFKL